MKRSKRSKGTGTNVWAAQLPSPIYLINIGYGHTKIGSEKHHPVVIPSLIGTADLRTIHGHQSHGLVHGVSRRSHDIDGLLKTAEHPTLDPHNIDIAHRIIRPLRVHGAPLLP